MSGPCHVQRKYIALAVTHWLRVKFDFDLTHWLRVKFDTVATVKENRCILCNQTASEDWSHLLTECTAAAPHLIFTDTSTTTTRAHLMNTTTWNNAAAILQSLHVTSRLTHALDSSTTRKSRGTKRRRTSDMHSSTK